MNVLNRRQRRSTANHSGSRSSPPEPSRNMRRKVRDDRSIVGATRPGAPHGPHPLMIPARFNATLTRVGSAERGDARTGGLRTRQEAEASMSSTDSHDPRAPAPASPAESISATVPDWSRETFAPFAWDPSRRLLRALRDYQASAGRSGVGHTMRRGLAVLRHRLWSIVCGCDIPLNAQLGGGLLLPHPNGIVIHPGAVAVRIACSFSRSRLARGARCRPTQSRWTCRHRCGCEASRRHRHRGSRADWSQRRGHSRCAAESTAVTGIPAHQTKATAEPRPR